jgi:hypothetical protein
MPEYRYSQLSSTSIRLLRLLPRETDLENLRCELFEYPLYNSDKSSRPYEALSYAWGSEDKPKTIIVDNQSFNVTQSLYTALIHMQDYSCSRILWIDAICINQAKYEEKTNQIPLMAEIYAKAIRVVVWLGVTEDNSDRALEAIRLASEKKSAKLSSLEDFQQPVIKLLQRQWFRRVWVRK